jgi:hypothetical protein
LKNAVARNLKQRNCLRPVFNRRRHLFHPGQGDERKPNHEQRQHIYTPILLGTVVDMEPNCVRSNSAGFCTIYD